MIGRWMATARHVVRRHRWTAAALVALGYSLVLAGATIGGVSEQYSVGAVGPPVLWTGIAAMVVGIVWLLLRALRARAWATETANGTITRFGRLEGPGQLPRPGDVDQVIDHATRLIDPGLFYDTEQLLGYLEVNPGALRVLRHDMNAPTRLTGYYVLLGLSERAEKMILNGAIDVGVAVVPELTVPDPGTVDALYLGMVQGFGGQGSSGAVLALDDHIRGIAEERGGGPIRVYARRGTDRGGKHMEDLGFTPVRHTDGIEVANFPNPATEEIRRERVRRISEAGSE